MKWISKDNDWLVIFFLVTDIALKRIEEDKTFYTDVSFMNECSKDLGSNAHVIGMYNNIEDTSWIEEQYKEALKKYKSISWWDRNTQKYHVMKG